MGLLDELLKDANRILDKEGWGPANPITDQTRANLDHIVDTANRVLNARFKDVLRGRTINLIPQYDARTRTWRLEASLQISLPFSMMVTDEVLRVGAYDRPALTQLASREAEKLSQHIVTELTRQLGAPERPKPNRIVPPVKHPDAKPVEEPIPDMPFGKED